MDVDARSINLINFYTKDVYTVWGMPMWACWIVIAILLVISGMFSASENAFSNCNKFHFKAEAEKGKTTARVITYLIDKFDNTLTTVLISSNTIQTIMSFLSAMLWYNICQMYGLSSSLEAILSTVMMGFLFYVIADTIPKVISKAIPNQMAIIMAYPIFIIQFILLPLIFAVKGLLKLFHKIFKAKDENIISKEDLIKQVEIAVNDEEQLIDDEDEEKEALFENDEKEIIDNIISFDKQTVKEVYTPIDKVTALNIEGLTIEEVNHFIASTDFSRIPVYEEEKQNVIGILVVKTYFQEYCKDPHLSIPSILEEVIKVDASLKIDDAFKLLNSNKVHLGIVMENESIIGIISMEDILEEIVEDIDEDNTIECEVSEDE